MRFLLLAALAVLSASGVASGPASYICKIAEFKIPGPDTGNLEWMGESAMETTVAIDRTTGRVIHPIIGNTSFNYVTILNKGSALAWSFKVLADSGSGGHVRYYEVHEFVPSPVKPFLAVADGIAFIGECA